MRGVHSIPGLVLLLAILAGCATTGEIPVDLGKEGPIYISPGVPDGVQDAVDLELVVTALDGTRVAAYEITVTNDQGEAVFSQAARAEEPGFFEGITGSDDDGVEVPQIVVWDGTNDQGTLAVEGTYTLRVTVTDNNGNTGDSGPREVVVDNTPPSLELSAPYTLFSPNDDGRVDVLPIYQRASTREDRWRGEIRAADGTPVRVLTWEGRAQSFDWDGTNQAVEPAEEGEYSYHVGATDRAGNSASFELTDIRLEREPRTARIGLTRSSFSPNNDGRADTIGIAPRILITENLERWELQIRGANGTPVRSYEGVAPPESFFYDGTDEEEEVLPDGTYRAVLMLSYEGGQEPEVSSDPFTVDTNPPRATVRVEASVFSPDRNGMDDTVRVRQSSSEEREWVGRLSNASGDLVRTERWTGRVSDFLWDGTDTAGDTVPDGTYTWTLSAVDEAENAARPATARIILDTSPPQVDIALTPLPFTPDGDGENDVLSIRLTMTDESRVRDWEATIYDPTGAPFASWEGPGVPRDEIRWNGRSGEGELVQSAEEYRLVVRATDRVFNTAEAEARVPVGLLLIREEDRLRIRVSSIYFVPYTADYVNLEPEQAQRNLETLDRLAELLREFPEHSVRIEGHAVHVLWEDPERREREQREVLIPLSLSRAEAIRDALVDRGINRDRMSVAGLGGSQPVVPHGDMVNRWKNRRVEFILREDDEE